MKVILKLFGAYRALGEELVFLLPEHATIFHLRENLVSKLEASPISIELITSSRFAIETEILKETASLQDGAVIAIIPPVAGG